MSESAPNQKRRYRFMVSHGLAVLAGVLLALAYSVFGSVVATLVIGLISAEINPPAIAYHYASPVPGCVNGQVVWAIGQAKATCLPDRTNLVSDISSDPGQAIFVDQHRLFPSNYAVMVKISGISDAGCAGILVRGDWQAATGLVFYICPQGRWEVVEYAPDNASPVVIQVTKLPVTSQDIAGAFSEGITVRGNVYEVYIDGKLAGAIEDDNFANTTNVSLVVSPMTAANFAEFAIAQVN